MSVESRSGSVANLVAEAFAEITALGDELQSWLNGMSEKQAETDRGRELAELIEEIESGAYEPEVPSTIDDESVDYEARVFAQMSRATRRDNAVSMLEAVIGRIEEGLSETSEDVEVAKLKSFKEQLEEAIEGWKKLEFPSAS